MDMLHDPAAQPPAGRRRLNGGRDCEPVVAAPGSTGRRHRRVTNAVPQASNYQYQRRPLTSRSIQTSR